MLLFIKNILILLKRFGVTCLLAVVGMAIAFSVFYMTVVQSFYDFYFDRNFEKAKSIYLYSRIISPRMSYFRTRTNTFEQKECAERYSEIKNFCYLQINNENIKIKDEDGNERIYYENVTSSSIGFIDMFKPKILYGEVRRAFTPEHAMLTESTVKKLPKLGWRLRQIRYVCNLTQRRRHPLVLRTRERS